MKKSITIFFRESGRASDFWNAETHLIHLTHPDGRVLIIVERSTGQYVAFYPLDTVKYAIVY